jgi:FkbM family methyltransferase
MNPQHIFPQILLRSWPFPRGSGRIIDHYFSHLAFDAEVAAVRTTDGFTINVLPNEHIGRHIYLTGEFDRSTVEVLLKHSEPGDVLLDIGANIGYVSACFLQNVNRSKVIAIEPQPKIVDLLQSNLKPFGDERYKVFPVALSDKDASGWLEICDLNRGASKIVAEQNKQSVKVELWSTKRLFESVQGEKIGVVKIDVEGHEATVLRACEVYFGQVRPRAILFEDHTRSAGPDGSLGQIFGRIGYRVFGVKKHLTRLEFVPITAARDCEYNDYLAVPA